jgi:hypothetical protein
MIYQTHSWLKWMNGRSRYMQIPITYHAWINQTNFSILNERKTETKINQQNLFLSNHYKSATLLWMRLLDLQQMHLSMEMSGLQNYNSLKQNQFCMHKRITTQWLSNKKIKRVVLLHIYNNIVNHIVDWKIINI